MKEVTFTLHALELKDVDAPHDVRPREFKIPLEFSTRRETRRIEFGPVQRMTTVKEVLCDCPEVEVSALSAFGLGIGESFEFMATWDPA